jgi:perosamine synthetase
VIPVNEPLLDGNEKKYLLECIESGWISSEGPFIRRFEEQFAARIGRRYAVAVASGTAALDIAVEALDVGPGDEVILPAFTIISCIGQIVRAGATPVLVDSDPLTWNMNVDEVASRITPRTKAIMAVHIYGLPVDMDPLLELARRHGIAIIEDAAQMHGQTYKGRPCGTLGTVSAFSFYANKHVTTGEGGIVATDDAKIADSARSLRNLGFQPAKRFVHDRLGWNYRMTNMQAAVGLAQLERLDDFVSRKRRMGQYYAKLLSGARGVQLPLERTDYAENIYWVYGLVLDASLGIGSEEAMRRLSEDGIGSRPFFCPMHRQPVLERMGWFGGESYPVAERLYDYGFYIPSGLALTAQQAQRAAEGVRKLLR